jgi:hypothetical protein
MKILISPETHVFDSPSTPCTTPVGTYISNLKLSRDKYRVCHREGVKWSDSLPLTDVWDEKPFYQPRDPMHLVGIR